MYSVLKMPVLDSIVSAHAAKMPFAGKHVLICTHAKREAEFLVKAVIALGGNVFFLPVSYSRDEEVIADINQNSNCTVLGSPSEIRGIIEQIDYILEDGARITSEVYGKGYTLKPNLFSVEQTTSGAVYCREMVKKELLPYPVLNVAESFLKLELENTSATPDAIVASFMNATGVTLNRKNVLLIGYGKVGQGVARLLAAHGAHVFVFEKNVVRSLIAESRGFTVIKPSEFHNALKEQDIIISCTSNRDGNMFGIEEVLLTKNGCIAFNAGSGTGEFAKELLQTHRLTAHRSEIVISQRGEHFICDSVKADVCKRLIILAEGYPINLRIGSGTASEVIDYVFGLMLYVALMVDTTGLEHTLVDIGNEVEESLIRLGNGSEKLPLLIASNELVAGDRPFGSVTPVHVSGRFMDNCSCAKAVFNAGTQTAGHYHLATEETYFPVSGTADIEVMQVDGDWKKTYRIGEGHFLVIPAGFAHKVIPVGDQAFVTYVIGSPAFSFFDQFFPSKGM